MTISIKLNKNNYLFDCDINRIGKSSLLKYKPSPFAKTNNDVDILNTSAPVKISDYISNKLVNNTSVTPQHKQWASQNKSTSDSAEFKQPQENKIPNVDTLSSAARIAQKIQELSQETFQLVDDKNVNKTGASNKSKLSLFRILLFYSRQE